jgi:menaquinone-specific isochorismate synthase
VSTPARPEARPQARPELRTERLDDDRALLDLLPDLPDDERFVFVEDGEGIVGWGVATRIAVGTGPDRFARARDGLAAFAATLTHDTDARVPHALIAFASFTFDEDEDASVMVVPRTVITRRDGATWRTTVDGGGMGSPEPHIRDTIDVPPDDRPRYAGSTVRDDLWLEAVARALEAIDAGEYAKVVLARDLHVWSRSPFDVRRLLGGLAERFPSCMTFLVDHLLGASPELLVRRHGRRVASRVLAGTAPRGADATEDAALGAALLASDKDRREHDLALRSAVASLRRSASDLAFPDDPSLVRLDNVQHLGSDLSGTLDAAEDTHILSLLADLHPTAAVGGAPRDAALAAIRALEGMSRGRYAGPVGWCTPEGDGEFAIALRCAEVRGDRARLFAGAGVVAGSLPEAELTETWLKLRAMTGVLGA